MLTIFSIPKPFRGHIAVIQTNAIRSWTLLRPQCEVMLFGDEKGTAEIATELGVRHFPDVVCNEYGTPLVNSVFEIAQNVGRHRLMCYANADIILMSDFLRAITQVRKHSFLLVGQRWDVEVKEPVDFGDPLWERTLLAYLKENGKLHPKFGIDYFVFPRGLWGDILPFAIGRPGWDNWMIYRARSLGLTVVDATKVITAVHQNHDYSHVPAGEEGMRKGAEAKRNLELRGGEILFVQRAGCDPSSHPRWLEIGDKYETLVQAPGKATGGASSLNPNCRNDKGLQGNRIDPLVGSV